MVLCGGESMRMGMPKALLPFGDELMLQRVVRILSGVVDSVVIVASATQQLPPLSGNIEVARDRREGCGPLEGLGVGLTALQEKADVVFVTGCDAPFLHHAFIERLFALLGEFSVAVPHEKSFYHPLAAVYRCSVLAEVEQLIAADRMRPAFLFDQVTTRKVSPEEWQDIDPDSNTLRNINQPADYFAALKIAGLTAPTEVSAALGNSTK